MSEKLEKGLQDRTKLDIQDSPEATPVKKEWFDGFIEGVSRFPQGFFAISLYTGRALLKADNPNFQEFLNSNLSHEQTERLAMLAERRHKKGDVEIRHEDARAEEENIHKPAASKVEDVWDKTISQTHSRLQEFARILTNGDTAKSLTECVNADPTVLGKLRQVIQVYTDILSSPLGVELGKRYVSTVIAAHKHHLHTPLGFTRYQKLREARDDLDKIQKIIMNTAYAKLLGVFPDEKYPTIARKLVNVVLVDDWP